MGIVVEQSPEPGAHVRRNSVVTVSVLHPPAPGPSSRATSVPERGGDQG
jgi:beta-lactam-binding protein with PASTA domain